MASRKRLHSVLLAAVLAGLVPAPAHAEIPLPRPRPDALPLSESRPPVPLPRPGDLPPPELDAYVPETIRDQVDDVEAAPAPPAIYQAACPAVFSGDVTARALPPIDEGTCQVASPLEVTALRVGDGKVTLSAPAILTCSMAGQLATWIRRVSAYTDVMFKAPVDTLLTGTSYLCRPRNNEPGAKFSEHGFANALDVVGFRLTDGTIVSLPDDWLGNNGEARAMRYAHDAACGVFTTTLGPEANALHKDHLHVDLGCHGKTCTYRMCE